MNDSPQAPPSNPPPPQCPNCHALNRQDQRVCWLCQQALDPEGRLSRVPVIKPPLGNPQPPLPPVQPDHFQFSLSTLMLAMTLIAVLCGLCVIAPGLGIPLAILAVPAWIRASYAMKLDSAGKPKTTGSKIEKFFVSLGAMLLVCIGAGAAGFAACSAICYLGMDYHRGVGVEFSLPAGLIIGSVLGITVLVWLCIKLWPRRK